MPLASTELPIGKTYEVAAENTAFSIEKGFTNNGIQKGSWLCCENIAYPILSGRITYSESKKLEIILYSTDLKIIGSASGEF